MNAHPFLSHMLHAVSLAQRGLPAVAPNPAVGALLVKDNKVLAEGWHKQFGGAHAEIELLNVAAQKGIDLAGCTMVVTLEPCCHHGKTPPCTEAILKSGLKHVVIGTADPTKKASGGAIYLAQNGVKVEMGVAEKECRELIADFIFWQQSSLPYITLKMASTLDGFIATRAGKSRWISGVKARQRVHILRSRAQAVLVGGGTLRTDDPLLTVRLPDMPLETERSVNYDWLHLEQPQTALSPLGVVVSGQRLDMDFLPRLIRERADQSVFMATGGQALFNDRVELENIGVRFIEIEPSAKMCLAGGVLSEFGLRQGLEILRKDFKCWRVLCEGGGNLGLSLLKFGLVQEFELHLAPCIMGDTQAKNIFEGLAPLEVDDTLPLVLQRQGQLDKDIILQFKPGLE